MPLYEYSCEACGERFELIQKFSDPAPETCVRCGQSPVRRLPSSPAIQFKGTGWYITDYSQKGKPTSEEKAGTDGKGAGKSESAAKADGSSSDAGQSSEAGSRTKSEAAAPAAAGKG